MIAELEVVALTKPLPEFKLQAGDTGTVVMVLENGAAYIVEFTAYDGTTIAVETVEAGAVRPIAGREILQTRVLA
jgi:hypothetical protein